MIILSIIIILTIVNLYKSEYIHEPSHSDFSRINPSNWGNGWDIADPQIETAMLMHPFYAHFDIRNRNHLIKTTELSEVYVRIMLTSQPEHLPSFFDNWNNKFLEHMQLCSCRYYYLYDNNNKLMNITIDIPVSGVYVSSFDWSWYPSPFSTPYAAYCALSSNYPGILPTTVTLIPRRKNEFIEQGIYLSIYAYIYLFYNNETG
jgi:hypothetical protein